MQVSNNQIPWGERQECDLRKALSMEGHPKESYDGHPEQHAGDRIRQSDFHLLPA